MSSAIFYSYVLSNPYLLLVANLANTKNAKRNWKMTETLANGYLYERTQRDRSNECQLDRVLVIFQKSLLPCALDESSLSIERVKH